LIPENGKITFARFQRRCKFIQFTGFFFSPDSSGNPLLVFFATNKDCNGKQELAPKNSTFILA
jgi:hypothetical protein